MMEVMVQTDSANNPNN